MRKILLKLFATSLIFIFFSLFISEKFIFESSNQVDDYVKKSNNNFITPQKIDNTLNTMQPSTVKFYPSDKLPVWSQENRFLDSSTYYIQGFGPDIYPQLKKDRDYNMIDILVVGDSFVYGEAIENTEIRWERMLQYYLDNSTLELYNRKIFNVIPLARGASSFNNYIEWMTEKRINKVKPDGIVFSYVGNDSYPSFTEKSFCRELNTCTDDNTPNLYDDCGPRCDLASCLLGESNLFGKIARKFLNPYFPNTTKFILERYCDPDKLNQRYGLYSESSFKNYEEIEKHPYYKIFTESVKKGSIIAIPKFIYHAQQTYSDAKDVKEMEIFKKYNYVVIDNPNFRNFTNNNYSYDKNYMLNIDDKHPNGLITSLYGKDVAESILSYYISNKIINQELLNKIPEYKSPEFQLSNFLPGTYKVSNIDDTIILSHDYNYINNFLGNEYPYEPNNQYFPCARLNHPHTRHVFSRDIEKLQGKKIFIEVFLESNDSGKDYYLQPFGISPRGEEILFDNFIFKGNKTYYLEYLIPSNFSGFFIVDNSRDCQYYLEKNLNKLAGFRMNMPSFTIKYKLIR